VKHVYPRARVTNGPDKRDLTRASAGTEGQLRVLFDTPVDSVEAQIDAMQEIGADGLKFALRGHLTSSNRRGAVFVCAYDCQARRGRLVLQAA
jgi:hypothetical protein